MVALNKEGYNSPTSCGMHQGLHRELVINNSRPLGPSGSLGLSATLVDLPTQTLTPPELKFPADQTQDRGTRTLEQRCHQMGPGRR